MTFFTKKFEIGDEVKVVSFDIFDTLLCRAFEKPSDLFRFMEPKVAAIIGKKINFLEERKRAERSRRKAVAPREDVLLEEIYDEMEIPLQNKPEVMALEKNMELKLCFKRQSGWDLYKKVKGGGYPVIAVSDIYLDKAFLEQLLAKNGYEFDFVFSSGEYGKTKATGSLFEVVVKKMDVVPSEVLHIGDNLHADIVMGEKAGLRVFHLPMLRREVYKNKYYRRYLKGRKGLFTSAVVAGLNNLIDSSEHSLPKSSMFGGSLYWLGFLAFGPIIYSFLQFVRRNHRGRLFFLARDGFILYKIYTFLFGSQNTEYLYISRRSVMPLKVKSRDDIFGLFLGQHRVISVRDFIVNKLECSPEDINPGQLAALGFKSLEEQIAKKRDDKKIRALIDFYGDAIYARLMNEREALLKHLEAKGVLGQEVTFCDSGYVGTIQNAINDYAGGRVFGIYFLTNKRTRDGSSIGFYRFLRSSFALGMLARPNLKLMESTVFAAPHGSALRYSPGGLTPKLQDVTEAEEESFAQSALVQEGTFGFVKWFNIFFTQEDYESMGFKKQEFARIFERFANLPLKADAMLLEGIVFEDRAGKGAFKYKSLISGNLWGAGRRIIYGGLWGRVYLGIRRFFLRLPGR